jgi:hypothetical protein
MIATLFVALSAFGSVLIVRAMWTGWHPFRLALATIFTLVCSLIAQSGLEEHAAYATFTAWVGRAGRVLLAIAVVMLVIDLAGLVVFLVRRGMQGGDEGKVVREKRPLSGMSLGIPKPAGVSVVKVLYRRKATISMKSLIDGTATRGERWAAAGVIVLYGAFALVFVGIGMIFMETLLIGALVPIAVMGAWLYARLSKPWGHYRKAKRKFASRDAGPDASRKP